MVRFYFARCYIVRQEVNAILFVWPVSKKKIFNHKPFNIRTAAVCLNFSSKLVLLENWEKIAGTHMHLSQFLRGHRSQQLFNERTPQRIFSWKLINISEQFCRKHLWSSLWRQLNTKNFNNRDNIYSLVINWTWNK